MKPAPANCETSTETSSTDNQGGGNSDEHSVGENEEHKHCRRVQSEGNGEPGVSIQRRIGWARKEEYSCDKLLPHSY